MKKLWVLVFVSIINIQMVADEIKIDEIDSRVNTFAKKIVSMYEGMKMPNMLDKDNMLTSVISLENVVEFTIKNDKKNIKYDYFKEKVCTRLINFLNLDGEVKYLFKDSVKIYDTYIFTKECCK